MVVVRAGDVDATVCGVYLKVLFLCCNGDKGGRAVGKRLSGLNGQSGIVEPVA